MSTNLSGISKTLYVPMAGRIYAQQYFPEIISDDKLDLIKKQIQKDIDIFKGQSEYTLLASAVRSKNIDEYIKDFLDKNPDSLVVNLGCGLETYFYRLDYGLALWYEVDLPEVIELRENLVGKNERDISIAASIFDKNWIDIIRKAAKEKSVCFTASGLFYYFKKSDIIELIKNLSTVPNSQLIFDAVNKFGMSRMTKYMKQLNHEDAKMYFYVNNANELAKEISDKAFVTEERDYYSRLFNKKGMKLSTRISIYFSDKFHMVKMIGLKLN